MVEKKNQHYVPQFYFKFFSNDGKNICIFNINNKNHFVGPFKNQSSKDYFYVKGKEIEDAFEEIEQVQRESLKKLIESKSFNALNKERYIEVLRFITFQDTRTNYSKRGANEMTQHLVREYVKPKMLQDENIKKEWTEEEIKKLPLTFPADHLISINLGLQSPILISDLMPSLLINQTELEFLFSDHPIILYNLIFHKDTFESHIGFQSPGLLIFCPLSKDLCLLLYDSKTYQIEGTKNNILEIIDNTEIEKINRLQLYRCDKNIYYSSKNQKDNINRLFEKFLKNNSKHNEITKFEKLKMLNKPHSEVLMIGERNINEDLGFSFLKTKEIKEDFGRIRNQNLVEIFKKFSKK
jgi:hypothetical protein